MPPIRFLIDENIPESVGHFLAERGHYVFFAREALGVSSPDPLIAFSAETEGLVVVTHDRDFRRFSRLLPVGFRQQFQRGAGRVSVEVIETRALTRVQEEIDAIEFHYAQAVKTRRRLMLRINETGIQITTHTRRQ